MGKIYQQGGSAADFGALLKSSGTDGLLHQRSGRTPHRDVR
jgi:hypothetical protein